MTSVLRDAGGLVPAQQSQALGRVFPIVQGLILWENWGVRRNNARALG